jgi:hypothetical protein
MPSHKAGATYDCYAHLQVTQSYGQEVRGPDAAKPSEGPRQFDTPGLLCNPEKGPFEEGVED